MTFPLSITVGWHQYSGGSIDAYGEVSPVYTPPLNQPGTSLLVYAVAPRTTGRHFAEGHDRVITDKTMYAPYACPVGTNDYIDLPEGQYMIEGVPEDWSLGPFQWAPGVEYQLRWVTTGQ
jgi:hypothetical protein